jgi:hypothetical protein
MAVMIKVDELRKHKNTLTHKCHLVTVYASVLVR